MLFDLHIQSPYKECSTHKKRKEVLVADWLIIPAIFMNILGIKYLMHPKRGKVGFTIMISGLVLALLATKLLHNIEPMPNFFLIILLVPTSTFGLYYAVRPRFSGLQVVAPSGMFLNATVLLFNQGRMPVSKELFDLLNWVFDEGTHHTIIGPHTQFYVLSDWIYAPFFGGICLISIGDILMYLGVIMCAIQVSWYERNLHAGLATPLGD